MTLNKYETIAKKYFVEDMKSATCPGTTLSTLLNKLEIKDRALSSRTIEFLKQQELLALYAYVNNECSFTEYLSLAKLEQKNRYKTVVKKPLKEHQRQAKLQEKKPLRLQTNNNTYKNSTKPKPDCALETMSNIEKKVRKNYIFIDYENVQPLSFGLPKDYSFKVILFVGANQTKIPIELVTSMQGLGANAEYVRIEGNGKNALDFHMAFYLGRLFEKDPMGYFHIISKDSGFDVLIKHLRDKKVLIQRYSQLGEIPALKISNSKTIDEKIQVIVDYLIKRGNAKPRKVETLSNTINSLFMRALSKEDLETLINKLAQENLVTIEGTKIHYKLTNENS